MFNFKELLGGVAVIFVLGVAGFLYRNAMEQPYPGATTSCTQDAKVCPDGTAVGRIGPACTFAPCPAPNVDLPGVGIAFALPAGFAAATSTGVQGSLVASYNTTAQTISSTTATISIRDYAIPTGESVQQVMMAQTVFDGSGLSPTSMRQFATTTLGANTFQRIQVGRFEGQVQTAYYLARKGDVLRFDVIERNVTNWTDPSLVASDLPAHQALRKMLSTLQVGGL